MIDDHFRDINGRSYKVLRSTMPVDMIYDVTHDNPSIVEKF